MANANGLTFKEMLARRVEQFKFIRDAGRIGVYELAAADSLRLALLQRALENAHVPVTWDEDGSVSITIPAELDVRRLESAIDVGDQWRSLALDLLKVLQAYSDVPHQHNICAPTATDADRVQWVSNHIDWWNTKAWPLFEKWKTLLN